MKLASLPQRRRDLLVGWLLTTLTASAEAQQRAKVYRLAVVAPFDPVTDLTEAGELPLYRGFFEGLRQLGFDEGRSLQITRSSGEGHSERFADITLPKPMTSNSKAEGRFGKQDFYVAAEDVYVCPAGQKLAYYFTTEDKGLVLSRCRTNACQSCAMKHKCTTSKERLISRWEHEMLSRQCSVGSTSIQRRCASGVRRSSIPSARSRPGWTPLTS